MNNHWLDNNPNTLIWDFNLCEGDSIFAKYETLVNILLNVAKKDKASHIWKAYCSTKTVGFFLMSSRFICETNEKTQFGWLRDGDAEIEIHVNEEQSSKFISLTADCSIYEIRLLNYMV